MARHRLDPYAGRRKLAVVFIATVLGLLGTAAVSAAQPGVSVAGVTVSSHR
jgi:hypothetical protein